jgi:hypothetical protein
MLREIYVSDRNFGRLWYGTYRKFPQKGTPKGGIAPNPKQQIKEIRHIAAHLVLRFSTQPARL